MITNHLLDAFMSHILYTSTSSKNELFSVKTAISVRKCVFLYSFFDHRLVVFSTNVCWVLIVFLTFFNYFIYFYTRSIKWSLKWIKWHQSYFQQPFQYSMIWIISILSQIFNSSNWFAKAFRTIPSIPMTISFTFLIHHSFCNINISSWYFSTFLSFFSLFDLLQHTY